ncbi:MAG: ABC transporter ATP-binding protein [Acidobacteriaceae bacterium]|nr:ABC transporter ATP-binding protein [Acidobacteriaceae bacterium]
MSSETTEDVVIQAEGLGKRYRVAAGRRQHNTLRDLIAEKVSGIVQGRPQSRARREAFWALHDVTFKIRRGENVGIIGLNGAGKSTLLKILSRITEPTVGLARIAGRVGALLEVGTGFHGELSGRENIFLYGAILGMSKAEINRKFAAIVEFAGIADFIDTPIKRYSSGMYVRLAFSVAANLEPEILLLDEVLSVGDLPFQRKCMEFARKLGQRDGTILFVSHNMFSIKNMCNRVIYLRRGRIQFDGPTDRGIKLYEEDCRLSTPSWAEVKSEARVIAVTDVALLDESGRAKSVFDYAERMRLRFTCEGRPLSEPVNFIVAFVRSDGVPCCCYSTELDGLSVDFSSGMRIIELLTPPLKLVSEMYTIEIIARKEGFQELLCAQVGATFHVRHAFLDTHFGVFHETAEWSCGELTMGQPPLLSRNSQ